MTQRLDKRYEYVPAGIESHPKGLAIGVRYKKKISKDFIAATRKLGNGYEVELNDRFVFFLRANDKVEKRDIGLDLDEVVSYDFLGNRRSLKDMGYNYVMLNALTTPRKFHIDYDYEKTEDWPETIADSGGFQLRTGVSDFVGPEDTIKAQNNSSSIGISLDVPFPIFATEDVTLLARAAKVQRLNNKISDPLKRPSLSRMNVFHGPNLYLIDKYREVVEDENYDRVSIGGVRRLGTVPLVLRLMNVILKGKKYKHYHALGVSGTERWVALCYLAHKGLAPLITSDSSTYIQCAKNLQYYDNTKLHYSLDIRQSSKLVSRYSRLPCSCPVCSIVGSSVALTARENKMGFLGVCAHNLHVNRNYIDEIYELTKQPKAEIAAFLDKNMYLEKLGTTRQALDAIDMALQDGIEAAVKRHAPFLARKEPVVIGQAGGLFSKVQVTPQITATRTRVDEILKRFEDYHGLKR